MVVVIKTGRCKIQLGRDKRPFYKKKSDEEKTGDGSSGDEEEEVVVAGKALKANSLKK